MDCPWCGCGWLFTCLTCRKAFSFAIGVEIDSTWEELAREDLSGWPTEPADDDIAQWIAAMQEILADVQPERQYAILDGSVFPADAKDLEFSGWYAYHKLESLPQVEAMIDDSAIEKTLANPEYWTKNALSETE